MTPESLAALLGSILSLVFAYFPWIKDWYDGLDSVYKPILNAGLLLVLAFAVLGLGCLNMVDYFTCDQAGLLEVLRVWMLALVGNYLTYVTVVRQFKQR